MANDKEKTNNSSSNEEKWEYKEEKREEKEDRHGNKKTQVVAGAYYDGEKKFEKWMCIDPDNTEDELGTYIDAIKDFVIPL